MRRLLKSPTRDLPSARADCPWRRTAIDFLWRYAMLVTLAASLMVFASSCRLFKGCPTCPEQLPAPPAKIVKVTKTCMDAFVPPVTVGAWPDPNPDGTTTLSASYTADLFGFISYVRSYLESQYEKCKASAGAEQ